MKHGSWTLGIGRTSVEIGMADIGEQRAEGYFPKEVSRDQSKDTGMALVLICLVVSYFKNTPGLVVSAIVLLLINMTIPSLYKPLAKVWFGISNILGTITSKIILTAIFLALVTPVGFIRRISGVDSLQLKRFKKDEFSVFAVRDHVFLPEDIDRPY